MESITVTLDDETYRNARIRAAAMGMSVPELVTRYLNEFGSGPSEFERLAQKEKELRARVTGFSASGKLSREELYDRGRED